jgi:two-component system invasion response regulator UvrY
MLSFLVADDHEITRIGIIATIKKLYENCQIEEAENGKELFQKLKESPFDVLITDLGMPETDDYRLVDSALLIQPNLKILIFTINKEEIYASNYLKKGALGYIEKNSVHEEIIKAIQAVVNGAIYVSPKLTKSYIFGKMQEEDHPFGILSQREREICILLCKGKGLTEIASMLNLGVSTVGTHKARIMHKIGVDNLVELINIAQLHSFSGSN